LLQPPVDLVSRRDQQRSDLARLNGGEGVVAEKHVGRLVHTAVVDAAIGELDSCRLNAQTVNINAVDAADVAQ
jgi:hypothetical protein